MLQAKKRKAHKCRAVAVLLLFVCPAVLLVAGCAADAEVQLREEFAGIMKSADERQRFEKLVAFAEKSPGHQEYMYGQLSANILEAKRRELERGQIMLALCKAGAPVAGKAILDVEQEDPSPSVRGSAATCIGAPWSRVDLKEFPVKEYVKLISDDEYDASVRNAAVRWLQKGYGRNQIDFLASRIDDNDRSVRQVAIAAVKSCASVDDLPTILRYVRRQRDHAYNDVALECFVLRNVTGTMPPNANPEKTGGDEELKWWISMLKEK